MDYIMRILIAIVTIALGACEPVDRDWATPIPDCSEPVTSGPQVDEIRKLEEAGAQNNVKGLSIEDGKRMFRPSYISVGQDGKVTSLATMLSDWKAGPWATRFDIQDLQIHVYCDMAIAVGMSEALWIGAPEGTKPIRFRWLNVWTRSEGEWRLGATQFTRF